jgi:hypothetical protein
MKTYKLRVSHPNPAAPEPAKSKFGLPITRARLLAYAVTLFALAAAPTVRGGSITNFTWYSGIASVAATTIAAPSAPNNDDVVGASANGVFITQKNYTGIGPVDLVFDVDNTGGVTEYQFAEGVFNNTGLNWSSYHLELGFGHGTGFVASPAGDGLDFDAPSYNSPFNFNPGGSFFPTVSATEDDILASGGVMPNLSFAGNFQFPVDVPDGITSFTIRQSPIPAVVPEPGSGCLVVCGLVAAAAWRRRSKRT